MGTCIVLREKQRIYESCRDGVELCYFNTRDARRAIPESVEGGWCFIEAIDTSQNGNRSQFGEVGPCRGAVKLVPEWSPCPQPSPGDHRN